jgi:hypothetical protein
MTGRQKSIDFERIAHEALAHAGSILARWLPDGRREGHEWVARNPRRADRRLGSFKVSLQSGRWGDFATGDTGGDLIALAAFLFSIDQAQAAKQIADMLGVSPFE